MRIDGKVVLLTGASQGIGAACAAVFRKRGALLSLTARARNKLEEVAGPADLITAGDITSGEFRCSLVARTIERFGRIDILVNNAGVGLYAPTFQAPDADVRQLFELNVFAPVSLIGLVAPHMKERRGGTIVNVSSIAGRVTLPWLTLYSASKYAVSSLTDGLRMELRRYGIHTITVCPGYVRTGFAAHVLGGKPPEDIARHRYFSITAEQCAEAVARGVERNVRTVVTPRPGWIFIAAARLFPRLVDAKLEQIYRAGVPPE